MNSLVNSGTKILSVSSAKPKKQNDANGNEIVHDDEYEFFDFGQHLPVENTTEKLEYSSLALTSKVENKILKEKSRRAPIKCLECLDVFVENELMEDDFVRAMARGHENLQPCKSTFHICKFIDTFLDHYSNETILSKKCQWHSAKFGFRFIISKKQISSPY